MEKTDVELINSILAGDDAAFASLVEKYQKQVHALAWKKIGDFHIAEEITQDTFLKVYQKLSTLKNPNQFSGWLYVIATRRCFAWLRKRRIETESLEDMDTDMIDETAYSQYVAEEQAKVTVDEQREVVKKLLSKLQESERTVMVLHYFGDMTCEEISRFLGVSASAIKSRLSRARQRLKKEEPMIREALSNFQISANLTENIMRQIEHLNPVAPSGSNPVMPWVLAASSALLIVLILGMGSQKLARLQQPYSLDMQSEMAVELIDAPIVQNIDAKPDVRNIVGNNSDTTGTGNGNEQESNQSLSDSEEPTEMNLKTDKAQESTVHLSSFGLGGTGFFIAPDKIATNFHVLAKHTTGPITAKLGHKEIVWLVEGVVAFDIEFDIAILKVKGEGVPLSLGDSDKLQIGETVLLAGFPVPEGRYKVTEGVVEKIRNSDNCFQTTAEAHPGNSGSPVLNSKEEVIGIHYGHNPGNSPINAIKTLLAGSTSTESLEQWRKGKPMQAHFYTEQGKAKYYENPKAAIDDFNQALELNPDNAEVYKFRAKAKSELNEHQAVIEDYNQAIKLKPNDTEIYKFRAQAKSDSGDHKGAVEDYNQAIKINPDDADAYKRRGDAKGKLGDEAGKIDDHLQAVQLISDVLKRNPDDANTYNELGVMKRSIGDDAGAIEDFTQAIKLKPDDANAYNNRAAAKEALDDHIGAIDDYTQAIKLKPDDANAYNNRGWAKRKLDDHAGAIEDFTQVIKLKPDDANTYKIRAGTKVYFGDYAGAIDDWIQAIKLKPDDSYAYMKRGETKFKLDDYAGAIADYDKAIELKPKYAIAYHNRGKAKEALGQHDAAKVDFEKAKEIDPEVGK